MTRTLKAETNRPIGDVQQLDVASMGVEQGPHLLQGSSNPRFEILGMQPVEQEQAADELVCCQRVDQLEPRRSGFRELVEDPLEPGAVQFQESLHDLLDLPARAEIR